MPLSVGEAARELGVRPPVLSDLLYKGYLPASSCPLVGGRRLIPTDLLSTFAALLRRRGISVKESV